MIPPNYSDRPTPPDRLTPEVIERLSAYLDDALTSADRAALEAELQAVPALQRELDALRATRDLVRNLPTLRSPRDLRLTPAMIAGRPAQIIPFPVYALVSAAAAFLLIAVGVLNLGSSLSAPTTASVAALPTSTVTAAFPADGRTAITPSATEAGLRTTGAASVAATAQATVIMNFAQDQVGQVAATMGTEETTVVGDTFESAANAEPAPPVDAMIAGGLPAESMLAQASDAAGGEGPTLETVSGAAAGLAAGSAAPAPTTLPGMVSGVIAPAAPLQVAASPQPTAAALPTQAPTTVPPTSTPTRSPTVVPTAIPTVVPTAVPITETPPPANPALLSMVLIGLGLVLAAAAVVLFMLGRRR